VRTTLAIGIAVDLNTSKVVLLGAVEDVTNLIFYVREGFQDLALGKGVANASASSASMAAGAVAVDLGTGGERALRNFAAIG
jgi:hypothetical protein